MANATLGVTLKVIANGDGPRAASNRDRASTPCASPTATRPCAVWMPTPRMAASPACRCRKWWGVGAMILDFGMLVAGFVVGTG
jgi:hypothetical protein